MKFPSSLLLFVGKARIVARTRRSAPARQVEGARTAGREGWDWDGNSLAGGPGSGERQRPALLDGWKSSRSRVLARRDFRDPSRGHASPAQEPG